MDSAMESQNLHSHMLQVWYIYLQNWVIFKANVGKYSIHGAYGIAENPPSRYLTDQLEMVNFICF